jgi:hypothetical protein
MNRVELTARVGEDGVLTVRVPLDKAEANHLVRVVVEPLGPPARTQEEWLKFIEETAGKWEGELERPEQGEFEKRLEFP